MDELVSALGHESAQLQSTNLVSNNTISTFLRLLCVGLTRDRRWMDIVVVDGYKSSANEESLFLGSNLNNYDVLGPQSSPKSSL